MFQFLIIYFNKNKNFFLKKWRSLISLFIINIIFAIIYYYYCDSLDDWDERLEDIEDDRKYPMDKFFRRLYFSFVVFSGVGFGDIIPRSIKAKCIVILQIILSMLGLLQIVY
jgi:hypothetical protein